MRVHQPLIQVVSTSLILTADDDDALPWSEVVKRKGKISLQTGQYQTPQNITRKNWRSNLQLLHGTAHDLTSEEQSFSADVDLVAYGVNTRITALQLSKLLQDKELVVKDCRLLTKVEGARSLSYKVSIKSTDFELAKTEKIWPYMVGVRMFKHFNPTQRRKHDIVKSRYNKNGQRNLQIGVLKSNDGRRVHFVDEFDRDKYFK